MKTAYKITQQNVAQTLFVCLAFSQFAQNVQAASTDLGNVPMAVSNSVTPNFLVILDNSGSMDATMAGTLESGHMPDTRGNIGRSAMTNPSTGAIPSYRASFNWGLMSFATSGPNLNSTYAYYMGSNTGMVFTNNCTGYVAGVFNGAPATAGVSTDGGKKCIANPQTANGFNYITFDTSGDDSNINDVLYYGAYGGAPAYSQFWALSNALNSGSYNLLQTKTAADTTWTPADFSGSVYSGSFGSTDAGFVPWNPPITRQVYLPRGWGYLANVTGAGTLNEAVKPDSTAHFNNLMALLASETNGATGEIKNAAQFTPTAGTLSSAKDYFAGASTPITASCQQNFVMLVTDGLPTATTSGSMYSLANQVNTCNWSTTTNTCTSGTLSLAVNDVITQLTALRATTVTGIASTKPDGSGAVTGKYDIQTYVVGLGNTVVNASNFSAMNAMAYKGGGLNQALTATDAATFNAAINVITTDITAKTGAAAAIAVANSQVTSTNNASYASSYNSGTWTGDLNAYPIDLTTGLPGTTSLWSAGSAQVQLDSMTSASRHIATSTDAAGAIGGIPFQWASLSTTATTGQQALLNTPSVTPVDGAAVLAYLRGDTSLEGTTYRTRSHLLGDMINAEPVVVNGPAAAYADPGYQGTASTFKEANAGRTHMVYQGANDGMLHAFNAATGAEAWAYIPNLVMSTLNNLSSKSLFNHQYRVDGTPASGDVDFNNINCLQPCVNTPAWHTILVGSLGKGGRGYYALDVTNPDAANEAAVAAKALWEFPNSITNAALRTTAKLNSGYSFGKPIIVQTKATGWVVLVTSGYNNGTNAGDSGGDGLGHLFVLNPKTGDLIADLATTGCTSSQPVTTPATTPLNSPCGLAQINAYVDSGNTDNTTDLVYGGDLKGNVWRFDLSGSTVASWSVANMAVLKDAGGTTQPVTTMPELGKSIIGGAAYRFVYVGTGLYLGNTDVATTQTQTMYGLVDPKTRENSTQNNPLYGSTTPGPADPLYTSALPSGSLPPNVNVATPLRSNLVQQSLTTSGTTRTASTNPVDLTVKNGWYIDLNLAPAGERINTTPVLAYGVLMFTANIPSATVCVPGGSSWFYALNSITGGAYTNPTTGTLASAATFLGNALASRPVLIQLPSGKVAAVVHMSGDTTSSPDASILTGGGGGAAGVPPPQPPATPGKRVSWRELVQ